jgi:membrane-associated phospholipid phosphatase
MSLRDSWAMRPSARLTIGVIAGGALVGIFSLLRLVPVVDAADRAALAGRLDSGTALIAVERLALATISVATLAVGLGVLVLVWVRRGRAGLAVRLSLSVLGAAGTAELLKRLLPFDPTQPGTGASLSTGSFPSGHSAIAAAVALAVATTLGPRVARRWWGPLVAWVSLVAVGTVAAGWHRPSDAVGGILVAVVWHTALVRPSSPVDSATTLTRQVDDVGSSRDVTGWRWWGVAAVAILLAAITPRTGGDVEVRETASHLFVLGIASVLATTGVLMLLVPRERAR